MKKPLSQILSAILCWVLLSSCGEKTPAFLPNIKFSQEQFAPTSTIYLFDNLDKATFSSEVMRFCREKGLITDKDTQDSISRWIEHQYFTNMPNYLLEWNLDDDDLCFWRETQLMDKDDKPYTHTKIRICNTAMNDRLLVQSGYRTLQIDKNRTLIICIDSRLNKQVQPELVGYYNVMKSNANKKADFGLAGEMLKYRARTMFYVAFADAKGRSVVQTTLTPTDGYLYTDFFGIEEKFFYTE